MRERKKGVQQFSTKELETFLFALGASPPPGHPAHCTLPATIKTLDEIVTDYIIETSHAAALCASYSRRNKIKVDDFKFVLRRDPKKLGRVLELLEREREMARLRKGGRGEGEGAEAGWGMEGDELQRLGRAEARKEERLARKRAERDEDEDEEDGESQAPGQSQAATKEPKKRGRKKMRKD